VAIVTGLPLQSTGTSKGLRQADFRCSAPAGDTGRYREGTQMITSNVTEVVSRRQ